MIKRTRKPVVGCVMWLGVVSLVAIATAASADRRRQTLVDRVKAANDRIRGHEPERHVRERPTLSHMAARS